MNLTHLIKIWLLMAIVALSANGAVKANVASGPQNLGLEVHQGKSIAKPLMRQGKSQVSTTGESDIFIEEDTETGLLYAKARYYDPETGLMNGEDAWDGDQMIAPSLHKYLYAYQNPTVYVDPDGNCTVYLYEKGPCPAGLPDITYEQRQIRNQQVKGQVKAVGDLAVNTAKGAWALTSLGDMSGKSSREAHQIIQGGINAVSDPVGTVERYANKQEQQLRIADELDNHGQHEAGARVRTGVGLEVASIGAGGYGLARTAGKLATGSKSNNSNLVTENTDGPAVDAPDAVKEYLYRKDRRGPEVYEQGGFQAKKPESPATLENYVDYNADSKYIGTTKYEYVAREFSPGGSGGPANGYVHVIDRTKLNSTQRDVNSEIPNNDKYDEYEIAVENKIDSCSVRGCYQVDAGGNKVGEFIENPNYEP